METESTNEQTRSNTDGRRPRCRFCNAELHHTLVDLGMSPLCESYLRADQLNHMEPFYPLHVYVCEQCFLVQLEEYVSPAEIFTEYAYFSSYSDTWLRARPALYGADDRTARPRRGEPRRRGRQQRRLSAAIFRGAGHSRCSGIEPAANVQRSPSRRACRHADRVLRQPTVRASWSPRAGAPISSPATTCWRRCPT